MRYQRRLFLQTPFYQYFRHLSYRKSINNNLKAVSNHPAGFSIVEMSKRRNFYSNETPLYFNPIIAHQIFFQPLKTILGSFRGRSSFLVSFKWEGVCVVHHLNVFEPLYVCRKNTFKLFWFMSTGWAKTFLMPPSTYFFKHWCT